MEKPHISEEIKEGIKSPKEEEVNNYDLQPEAYLNPTEQGMTPFEVQKSIEGIETNIAYQNMIGDVFERNVLRKNMSSEEIQELTALLMEDSNSHPTEEEQGEIDFIMSEESRNKEEVEQGNQEVSIFTKAVMALMEYLVKYPKVAKLATIGVVASELSACAVAPRMTQDILGGAQQSVYAQVYGQQKAQNAAMQGQQREQNAVAIGQERANQRYQREIQQAESARQRDYAHLDNQIEQSRHQGHKLSSRDISTRRQQIESQYSERIRQSQMDYYARQTETKMKQEQIKMDTQMRQQQILMETQMKQQQIQLNMGINIMNQAIQGIMRGSRR